MLLHHADTMRDGIRWCVESYGLSVDADASGVRSEHAERNAHERRLPCPILTKQRVNRARAQKKARIGECDDFSKSL